MNTRYDHRTTFGQSYPDLPRTEKSSKPKSFKKEEVYRPPSKQFATETVNQVKYKAK